MVWRSRMVRPEVSTLKSASMISTVSSQKRLRAERRSGGASMVMPTMTDIRY